MIKSAAALVTSMLLGLAAGGALPDPLPAHRAPVPAPRRCVMSPEIVQHPVTTLLVPDMDHSLDPQVTQLELIDQSTGWMEALRDCARKYAERQQRPMASLEFRANGELSSVNVEGQHSIPLLLCVQHAAADWTIRPSTARFALKLPIEDCSRH